MKRFSSSRSFRRFFGIAPGAVDAAAHAHSSRIRRRLITKLILAGGTSASSAIRSISSRMRLYASAIAQSSCSTPFTVLLRIASWRSSMSVSPSGLTVRRKCGRSILAAAQEATRSRRSTSASGSDGRRSVTSSGGTEREDRSSRSSAFIASLSRTMTGHRRPIASLFGSSSSGPRARASRRSSR